jgi:putative hemolysin
MTVRILAATGETTATAPRYTLLVASDADEVRAAQRLRYHVFASELGARLNSPLAGLDVDEFDDHCDHLVVREDRTGETVGTYRMLPPAKAAELGRTYSASEFDLRLLEPLRDAVVETGRSCVHPDHRSGAVINLMWTGIARYLHLLNKRWLTGCASVPLADGGDAARAVWGLVRDKHLAPPRLRVTPRHPYPVDDVVALPRAAALAKTPALLRGYLRLGAWVCGPPAHDEDFNVADFLVLLSLDRIDPRYLRHFLGDVDAPLSKP